MQTVINIRFFVLVAVRWSDVCNRIRYEDNKMSLSKLVCEKLLQPESRGRVSLIFRLCSCFCRDVKVIVFFKFAISLDAPRLYCQCSKMEFS